MSKQAQNPDGFQMGDKVRIRAGIHARVRGVIRAERNGVFVIESNDGDLVHVEADDLTNYSLAARRAWQTAPKQAGRRPLQTPRKKMVSLRVDVDVWRGLSQAAEFGLIPSREQAVNQWLREHLSALLDKQRGGIAWPVLVEEGGRDGKDADD